jgi:hypothetical protein
MDGRTGRLRGTQTVTKLLLDADLAATIEGERPIHGLPDPERQG